MPRFFLFAPCSVLCKYWHDNVGKNLEDKDLLAEINQERANAKGIHCR